MPRRSRALQTAQRLPLSPAQIQRRRAESLRSLIPAEQYVLLIDQAIMTGHVPLFNPDGTFSGAFDRIDGDKRVELADKMVRRVLPEVLSTPEQLGHEVSPEEIHATVHNVEALHNLSSEDLQAMRGRLLETAQDRGSNYDLTADPTPTPGGDEDEDGDDGDD